MLPLLIFALVAPILRADIPAAEESNTERASPAPRIAKKSMDSVAGYVFGATAPARKSSPAPSIAPDTRGSFRNIERAGRDDTLPWYRYDGLPSCCFTYDTHRRKSAYSPALYDSLVQGFFAAGKPISAPRSIWKTSVKIEGQHTTFVDAQPLIGCFYVALPEVSQAQKILRVVVYGDSAARLFAKKNAGKRAGRASETLSKMKSEGKQACSNVFLQLKNHYDFISSGRFSDKDPIITAYETNGMGTRLRRIEFFMYPLDCPMMIAITDLAQEAADRAARQPEKPKAEASGWRL